MQIGRQRDQSLYIITAHIVFLNVVHLLPATHTPVPYFLLAQSTSVLFDEGHFLELELVKCKQAVLRPSNMCWRPLQLIILYI